MTALIDSLKLGLPMLLLVIAGFWVAFRFVEPAPPAEIVLASGEPGGAYAGFGERYREALAEYEIDVEVRYTAGSVENLELLRNGEVDVAFVQGGVADLERDAALASLGSLYFEPLWIFQRSDGAAALLSDLSGRRVNAGAEGSGTRAIALQLLRANGLTDVPSALSSTEAANALRAGELDAAFFVASADSPIVRTLLVDPSLVLLSVERGDGYVRIFHYLTRLTLPRGVIDFAADIPSADVSLIAPAANLVVGENIHPAVVDLLLLAATRIHSRPDVFSESGDFPTSRFSDLTVRPEATRYYKNGPPLLQRYLPFWLATLVDRLKVMLIPLVAVLFPLFRAFPPVYRWRVRSRIYRWYKELREIDPETIERGGGEGLESALREVERIEDEVSKVPTPPSYGQELYDLRLHVDFVRTRLAKRKASGEQEN